MDDDTPKVATVESIDERLIGLLMRSTGSAKEVFRRIQDVSQIEGRDNQEIFKACFSLYEENNKKLNIFPVDLLTAKLEERGSLDFVSVSKMERLWDAELNKNELTATVNAIVGRKQTREINTKVSELRVKLDDDNLTVDDAANLAREIADLSRSKNESAKDRIIGLSDILDEVDHIEEMPDTIPTGFPMLDEQLGGGLLKGSYSLMIGHTGTGKSIAMLSMYMNMLRMGLKPIYVNYEIARPLFMKFLFAQVTGVNVMRRGLDMDYLAHKKEEFRTTIEDLYERGLLLITDPMQGSSKMWHDVEGMLRELTDVNNADCIFFDTINSVYAKTAGSGQSARWNEYESIAISSERMCLEMNVPVLYSGQPKQDAATRDDPLPQLYDVAGGKVLTEKAAAVIHLHRTDILNPGQCDYSEFIITKNRVMGQENGFKPVRIKYDPDYKKLFELPADKQTTGIMDLTGATYDGPFLDGSSVPGGMSPVDLPVG